MKKKLEKFVKFIEKIKGNFDKKAIFFFGFYFVFFLGIILFIRFSPVVSVSSDRYENSIPEFFTFKVLINNNYHYKYTITLDDYKYEYEGDKNKELELFKYDNIDYFNNNNTFYRKDSSWEKVDNPYRFSKFLISKNIINLINESYYEESVMNDDYTAHHTLAISSNTLNKMLDNVDTDIEEVPNKIVVYSDKKGEIEKISYDLDSYCKYIDGCQNTLKIDLEYSNVGNIKEIKNPVNSNN